MNTIIVFFIITVIIVMWRAPVPHNSPIWIPEMPPKYTPEMIFEIAVEDDERYDISQAVDHMRGRMIITDQPDHLQRGFDRDLDNIGSSLNDTF